LITNCNTYGINAFGTGTGANETNGLRVDRSEIQYCPTGMNCGDYVEGLYIRNNIFFSCTTAGFSYGATNGRISCKIQENDFDTCGLGLYAQNLSNFTIDENWFSNNTNGNVVLKSTVNNGTVNGNQVYGNSSAESIEIGGDNVVMTGNLISGGSAGIYLKSTAADIAISANLITDCTYAVNCAENPTGISIVSNNLIGNVTGAIADAGTPNARYIADNLGYNPVGAFPISPTASPMTYTAGTSPETISLFGATSFSVTIAGTTYVSGVTSTVVKLGPQKSAVITYVGSPFMTRYIE